MKQGLASLREWVTNRWYEFIDTVEDSGAEALDRFTSRVQLLYHRLGMRRRGY